MKKECLINGLDFILKNQEISVNDFEKSFHYPITTTHDCLRFFIHQNFVFKQNQLNCM